MEILQSCSILREVNSFLRTDFASNEVQGYSNLVKIRNEPVTQVPKSMLVDQVNCLRSRNPAHYNTTDITF